MILNHSQHCQFRGEQVVVDVEKLVRPLVSVHQLVLLLPDVYGLCMKYLMMFSLLQKLREMEFADFIRTTQVEAVTLYQANLLPIKGTLCVTGHHLILSSRDNHIEELWVNYYLSYVMCTNVPTRTTRMRTLRSITIWNQFLIQK